MTRQYIMTLLALLLCTTAAWADRVTIVTPVHGTVAADAANSAAGATVTLTVTADTDYSIDEVTACRTLDAGSAQAPLRAAGIDTEPLTVTKTGDDTYQFIMPESPYGVRVTVTFAQLPTVTVEPAAHGTVTASDYYAGEGQTVTLTVTPGEGYHIDRADISVEAMLDAGSAQAPSRAPAYGYTIAVSGPDRTTYPDAGIYTFTMPEGAYTVLVTSRWTLNAPTSCTLSENDDSEATLASLDGETLDVTVGRTFYKDGHYNTLCLPFSLTASELAAGPLAGGTLKQLAGASVAGGTVTVTFGPATAVTANTPYIIRWEEGTDIVDPTFEDVTISYTASDDCTASVDGLADLIGIYKPTDLTASHNWLYLGSDDRLYYATSDDVKAFRCYLSLTGDAAQAPQCVIDFGDDSATSLRGAGTVNGEKGMVNGEAATSARWYTVDGRMLHARPLKKGIYIHNGRKEVIQ